VPGYAQVHADTPGKLQTATNRFELLFRKRYTLKYPFQNHLLASAP
jgi:hypothetical protein